MRDVGADVIGHRAKGMGNTLPVIATRVIYLSPLVIHHKIETSI